MKKKAQSDANIIFTQSHTMVLKKILIGNRHKTYAISSSEENFGKLTAHLRINGVMFTKHEFDQRQQAKVLIIEIIGFRGMMPLWNGLDHPMNSRCLIKSGGCGSQGNGDNAIGTRSYL